MRTTIDKAGRVVIPKAIRDRLHLDEGRQIDLRERDGVIELEPAPISVRLEDKGHGLVAVPADELPSLTDAMVRETLEQTRR